MSAGAQETYQATHYGESYNGSTLGCTGSGVYNSNNIDIVAVGPIQAGQWPCNTELLITGPAGTIRATRRDSCPGCNQLVAGSMIDLSEVGLIAVCGNLGGCMVTVVKASD